MGKNLKREGLTVLKELAQKQAAGLPGSRQRQQNGARGGYLRHLLGSSRESQRQKLKLHCEAGARLRPLEKLLMAVQEL